MAKQCSICNHRERDTIDRELVSGEKIGRIAKAFALPESNLRRHRSHLARVLARSEQHRASDLMQYVMTLRSDAERLQQKAEEKGDLKTAVFALRERIGIAGLLAKVEGVLKTDNRTTNVLNVTLEPETAKRMAETFLERRGQLPPARGLSNGQ